MEPAGLADENPACHAINIISRRPRLHRRGWDTIVLRDDTAGVAALDGIELAAEESLVASAREGSDQAWTAIYEANFPPIYRYVSARVFDETAAYDIAAGVFVAAISGIHSYSYRGRPLLAWLYRIAHNLVGDYRRKQVRLKQRTDERAVEGLHSTNGTRLEGDPAGMIDSLDLRDAMQDLPDSQRDVLILRFFVGLSTPEIARVMGKQAAAIYSLQARAVTSLRSALE